LKESEYIKATNRVKISMAITILRDVLPGKNYGIGYEVLSEVLTKLLYAEAHLFESFKVEEDEEEPDV